MTSVKDWYPLGDYDYGLGVPGSVRNEIRVSTDYKTEEEKKAALLQYFLDNAPMASWQTVAGALHYWEEEEALQMVQPFLPPSGESVFGDVLPLLVTVPSHTTYQSSLDGWSFFIEPTSFWSSLSASAI